RLHAGGDLLDLLLALLAGPLVDLRLGREGIAPVTVGAVLHLGEVALLRVRPGPRLLPGGVLRITEARAQDEPQRRASHDLHTASYSGSPALKMRGGRECDADF